MNDVILSYHDAEYQQFCSDTGLTGLVVVVVELKLVSWYSMTAACCEERSSESD